MIDHDNLDAIISVGYQVKSQHGVQFRIWATSVLKEYIKKGIAMDDNPKANVSIQFFKQVQNIIHYALFGETVAEVIDHRANAEKDFMGCISFYGEQPSLTEAKIAKNYLDKKELRAIGNSFLDIWILQKDRLNVRLQ